LAGPIVEPAPQFQFDTNFNVDTAFFETEALFTIPVKVLAGAQPRQHVQVDIFYQVCNDRTCLPPTVVSATSEMRIAGPSSASATTTQLVPQPAQQKIETQQSGAANPGRSRLSGGSGSAVTSTADPSFLHFLLLAMAMGGLSLLTPCVFPMIPITVSYFSSHAGTTRREAVSQALVYAIGIILTFSALGLALAIVFGAGGVNRLAANPWVNLLITAIFLAFALSLFGAFLLQLPSGLMTRLDSAARNRTGTRFAGALLMGLTFTLTSFTCTAPFVGTLLVMAAQGRIVWPLAGMLAYSSVFALPFFALALAPQMTAMLPKSGGWMNSVKAVMGFLEIAAAMKFLSNADLVWGWGIFTRNTVLAVWIAVGILTVVYILGYFRLPHDSPVTAIGAVRLMAAAAFLSVTIALVPGLFGRPLGELDSFLPPAESSSSTVAAATETPQGPSWILNDYDEARRQASRDGKFVFVDFTGYTCTNCRWMELNMFPRPEVARELDKFIRVRLYTDGSGDLYRRQQDLQRSMFRTVALPLYAIVQPDGTPVTSFAGLTRKPDEFVEFLKHAH
jgi:thiol:disulfide interchange protein DsbD